jgi:regulation of enolase protein 1 (concanavalin A-like superfamily)
MRWFLFGAVLLGFVGSRNALCQGGQGTKPIPGWGDPIDPDKDTTIGLDGSVLTIAVPAGTHELKPAPARCNAPRVLRDVEGNFEVSVKLSETNDAVIEQPDGTSNRAYGAGLVVWQDERNFVSFFRVSNGDAAKDGASDFAVEYFKDGQPTTYGSVVKLSGSGGLDTWLRLTRRGDKMKTEISFDGKTWTEFAAMPVRLSSRMRLGVFATNVSKQPFEARFSGLAQKAIPLYPPRDK